jgi:multidrug efflux system outer membrane protein
MKSLLRCGFLLAAAAFLLGAGCAVGPDYERPVVSSPETFRRAATDATVQTGTDSLGELGWWETFQDPQLTAYLAEALTNSWDIKIAAARVLQAEAVARITKSQFFPTVNAGADILTTGPRRRGPCPSRRDSTRNGVTATSSFRCPPTKSTCGAASAAPTRRPVPSCLRRCRRSIPCGRPSWRRWPRPISICSNSISISRIAQRTYGARTNSFELTRSRQIGGVASLQDVYQAQILVSTAEASMAEIHQQIEQQENFLNILLGRNPGGIIRGVAMLGQTVRANVPTGLPSSLLERRPDLRFAEQQLVAANADIGQAKAAFYPQVTLTGFAGFQSVALSDLFTGAAKTWQFGPAVTFPLFTGGRLRGNLKLAKARFEESSRFISRRYRMLP